MATEEQLRDQDEQRQDAAHLKESQAARAIWEELDREDAGQEASGDQPQDEGQPAPSTTEQPAGRPANEAPRVIAGSPLSDEDRALLRQIPEVMNLVKSTVGRVGSLQSELAKIGKASAAQAPGPAPTGTAIDAAARSPEKWEALKKDFPDWAEGVEAYVSSRTPSAAPQPAVDVDAIKTEVANEFEAKRREDALEVVAIFDADWQKKAGTPEFRQWIDAQSPEYRQRALNTWKASEILATVRAFDASRKPAAPAAPNPRLRGATIPNGTARVNLSKPVEEMTPQEYWAHLEAQDRKNQHAGR